MLHIRSAVLYLLCFQGDLCFLRSPCHIFIATFVLDFCVSWQLNKEEKKKIRKHDNGRVDGFVLSLQYKRLGYNGL